MQKKRYDHLNIIKLLSTKEIVPMKLKGKLFLENDVDTELLNVILYFFEHHISAEETDILKPGQTKSK